MSEIDTMSVALERLYRKGYTENIRAIGGVLRIFPAGIEIDPDDVVVDEIYRFEGETNLDDEAAIFALSCARYHYKGTYIVAFGPMMDQEDSLIVQRLHKKHY